MRNKLTMLIAVLIAAVLVAYMFVFTVRYDQAAVVTTFGRASPQDVITEPGPYLKWPWPIQDYQAYSTRLQVLEDQLEEQQTADGFAVIVRTYVAWRIADPLAFFTTLTRVDDAEVQLAPLLRDLRSIISQYRFDQLVDVDPQKLKLDEIERKARQQLQAQVVEQGYGIEIVEVGIRRLMLPEQVTQTVFERMRAAREKLAENTRSSGKAQADAIVSKARSTEQRILAFAERRAQAIRAEGIAEAARYYSEFQRNEQFAIFLATIEALREALKNNTTFVFGPESFPGLEMFMQDPGAASPQGSPLPEIGGAAGASRAGDGSASASGGTRAERPESDAEAGPTP